MRPEPPRTRYWRSLEQLAGSASATSGEFQDGASEPPALDDVSRRKFMGIVAATAAIAGMTSCRKPYTKILPFGKRPEDLVPGNPLYYATASIRDGYGTGILVKSSDGRPTKVEGNPLHALSQGGSDHLMQAELLNLYDPARSKHPVDHTQQAPHTDGHGDHGGHGHAAAPAGPTVTDFAHFLAKHDLGDGAGLRLLAPPSSSPSFAAALAGLQKKYPKAAIHTWSPTHRSAAAAATRAAFGQAVEANYDLAQADVVVSFDHDFQSIDGAGVIEARSYASRRRISSEKDTGKLSRLYAVECFHSVTGSNADHRFRVSQSELPDVVMALAHELKTRHGIEIAGDYSAFAAVAEQHKYHTGKAWIPVLAKELASKKGKSALLVGRRLPVEAQIVLHALNHALANVGKAVTYTAMPANVGADAVESIGALAKAMDAGSVKTLVILGGNPVYDAPADLEFGKKLAKVGTSIHLSLFEDETSAKCTWHVNQAHELECWGDTLGQDGSATLMQPLIAPLYGGISSLEMVALLTDGLTKVKDGEHESEKLPSGHDLVRTHWKPMASGSFETWWARALHDGVLPGTGRDRVSVRTQNDAVSKAVSNSKPATAPTASSVEVLFRPDYNIYDGRYANNSWLQELPDPMTKITWDNAALMSLATLRGLGVDQGDLVEVSVGGKTVKAPAWVLPGHADHSVTLTLGYGRQLGPDFHTANGAGFDAYALRTSGAQHLASGAKLKAAGGSYPISVTQEHGTMEGREIVREADAAEYAAHPTFAPDANPLAKAAKTHNEVAKKEAAEFAKEHEGHGHPMPEPHQITADDLNQSLWKSSEMPEGYDYKDGNQWAMVIDLNTCTGCNACVSACVSENNIAVVGKEQVAHGRDMFWNRIDRYFGSDEESNVKSDGLVPGFNAIPPADNPKVVHQMVPCMQCENASCEVVCPVAATSHSPEGLNDMAYNRCIGTRYCGNNCPYKVRKFNYLDFHGEVPETIKMTRNPDVTIRSRGVMEKCTYCVQRINRKKIEVRRKEGRRILNDGDNLQTACAQACPTEAITFGNKNDANSKVARLRSSNLNYGVLEEMNMRPRTTYLAKIRNPNPELVS